MISFFLKSEDYEQQTVPPEKSVFCGMANQWIIYDSYEQHEIEKEKFEERERKKNRLGEHDGSSNKGRNCKKEQGVKNRDEIDKIISGKFMKAAKILERMVNQGIYDQVIKGYVFIIRNLDNMKTHI